MSQQVQCANLSVGQSFRLQSLHGEWRGFHSIDKIGKSATGEVVFFVDGGEATFWMLPSEIVEVAE